MTDIPAEITDILAKPNPAVIATVRPDGAPVSVATWYLWDGDRILLNLDAGRKRLEHMRADQRVSLTVLDNDGWHQHVSIQGRVTIEVDPDLSGIDRLAKHYTGKPYWNRDNERVNAWLEVESYHTWGYQNRTQASR